LANPVATANFRDRVEYLGPHQQETGRIASNLQSTLLDLQRRKARGRRGLALVEGVRLVEEALAAGLKLRGALISPDLERTARGTTLRAELKRQGVIIEEVSARSLEKLADTETPQGIVAVVEPRKWTADELPLTGGGVALVIDGVQDPGNVGTLIRTAHALGAAGTIVLRGTADIVSPKALRAAMGATFRHPVVALDDNGFIAWARKYGVTLWAAAADGAPLHRALSDAGKGKGDGGRDAAIAVIVGNEGAGVRPQLNAVSTKRVAIPLAQGSESLNVAVAAGILLYEVLRGH
jgi:RNA methyltransferase, TrmH family